MVLRRLEPFMEMIGIGGAIGHVFWNGFSHSHRPLVAFCCERNLLLDVYHTPESVVVKAAISGVKSEEMDVIVTGNIPTIKVEAKEKSYLMRERRYRAFSRTITFPRGLKTDEIEVTCTTKASSLWP